MKPNKDNSFMPKKQKQGIIFSIGLAIGVVIAILIFIIVNLGNSNTTELDEKDIAYTENAYNSKEKSERDFKERDYEKRTKRTYNPSPFNPNTVTKTRLVEFGLSEKQASNVVNYVKAGGKFKKTEDLKKLYCMSGDLYNAISPYVQIPNQEKRETQTQNLKHSNSSQNPYSDNKYSAKPYEAKPEIKLDLNQSDSLDLQILRGIGPSYGKRIYIYGQKLGGYTEISQLKEVYGMTDSLYSMIVQHLKIEKANPRKININTATIKELSAHPYIDFYLAKAIIRLRIDLKNYTTIDQIRQIHLLDQKSYEKLIPYLEL